MRISVFRLLLSGAVTMAALPAGAGGVVEPITEPFAVTTPTRHCDAGQDAQGHCKPVIPADKGENGGGSSGGGSDGGSGGGTGGNSGAGGGGSGSGCTGGGCGG